MIQIRCPAGLAVVGCPQCAGVGYIRMADNDPTAPPATCPEQVWAQLAAADVAIIEASSHLA